jgi:predicted dehydrogenase
MHKVNPGETIGFGLIGTGMIANYHAEAIRALSAEHNVSLAGVVDLDPGRAETFARRHGIPFHTHDLAALLARPDVHIVCVLTPSGAHLEPALQAIAAGRHVVIEKPLEITVARVDTILEAAQRAGVLVGAIFQARFSTGARALKAALDAGRFGRLVLCSAYVKWHRTREYYTGWKGTLALDGGGAVMNQSIHAVDLLQWFAGMPTEVFAWTTQRVHTGIEAEDTACCALKFGHGALGVLEATTAAYPGWERRIEICGELGSAAIEDDRIIRWDFREADPGDAALRAGAGSAGGSGAGAPDQISTLGHQRQLAEIILAARGQAPLTVSGRDARSTVALICGIYQSARDKVPVAL